MNKSVHRVLALDFFLLRINDHPKRLHERPSRPNWEKKDIFSCYYKTPEIILCVSIVKIKMRSGEGSADSAAPAFGRQALLFCFVAESVKKKKRN